MQQVLPLLQLNASHHPQFTDSKNISCELQPHTATQNMHSADT